MTDIVDSEKRSEILSRIRDRNLQSDLDGAQLYSPDQVREFVSDTWTAWSATNSTPSSTGASRFA